MLSEKRPPQPDDILQGCLRGDRRAMELFYKKHYSSLYPVAARYARDELETREILNTAMLKIFQSLPFYQPERPILPWMKTILIHTALDNVRSHFRRNPTSEIELAHELYVDDSFSDVMDADTMQYLLRQLSEESRTVLLLFAVEGYSHQEIGEQLNITESNSRWRLHQARRQFIQILAQHEIEKKSRPAVA